MADIQPNPTLTDASAISSPSPLPSSSFPSQQNNPIISIDNHSFQITQYKLNGTNFKEWFQSVMLVIKGKGKAGYLTGSILVPPAIATTYGVWEAENSTIMAWLINSMEPRIGRTYLFYKIAKEIWDSVQEMYLDLEKSPQCFEIRSAIRSTKQGIPSVTEYF